MGPRTYPGSPVVGSPVVKKKNEILITLPDTEEFHDKEEVRGLSGVLGWHDLTGMKLDAEKLVEARAKEIKYTKDKQVYKKIPRWKAKQSGWKIVRTRWIDINKGDDLEPIYRSRLVAKEFNDSEMDGIFAGTPPLEALRSIIHEAATVDGSGEKMIMIADVARAFFEAKATREVCIEIPEEDMTESDKKQDMVGYLMRSLYGTRDAAMNWQAEVSREMKKWGFEQGVYNPCLYVHKTWGITTMVHGDDFVSVGTQESLKKLEELMTKRFELKIAMVGREEGYEKESRILNRIVRVTENGWEYEPDQRHAEIVIKEFGLENAKEVAMPTEPEKKWEEEENAMPVEADKATRYRRITARLDYLAALRKGGLQANGQSNHWGLEED